MAQTPITITANNFSGDQVGAIFREYYNSNPASVNVGSPGANQVWDFSNGPVDGTITMSILHPASAAGYEKFPEANVVWSFEYSLPYDGFKNAFCSISDSEFTVQGFSVKQGGPPSLALNDPWTLAVFPLTYGTSWTDTASFEFEVSPGIVVGNTITREYIVDAYGTIIVPAGEYPCLRIRRNESEIQQVTGQSPDTAVTISYGWITENIGFGLAEIESMEGETNPNFTQAKSFSRMLDLIVGIEPFSYSHVVPKDVLLYPNMPNPFNPTTAISYQLSAVSDVDLGIYNLSGQHIKTLVKRRQSAGRYQILWDGTDEAGVRVASGVYLMALRAGEFVQARKIILMK